jgi:hypothetical protein
MTASGSEPSRPDASRLGFEQKVLSKEFHGDRDHQPDDQEIATDRGREPRAATRVDRPGLAETFRSRCSQAR